MEKSKAQLELNVTTSEETALEDGRDELNLAEFPLAALADRVPDNQKTLVFEDNIWDSGKAETITRRLTITASDKYGLPTSLDDEVILGLIQLTRQRRFVDRTVHFSRYRLIDILGWRHEGRSYGRLEKSLKRWLGVTLYYDKAWWDKEAQSWVDESFHILEQLTLYDQERRIRALRNGRTEAPLSSFTWNSVVFRSFKAGYLKALDLRVLRQLKHAAAKRMYRFLDKRFYHKPKWEFDLAEFACEHVGLSRNYDNAQLKRRLEPAIEELEGIGFLERVSASQRFIKVAPGEWRIRLSQKSTKSRAARGCKRGDDIVEKLTSRGVTPSVAAELVECVPPESINSQIECFDRRLTDKQRKAMRNPAGFLVKAIRENYSQPQKVTIPQSNVTRPRRRECSPSSESRHLGVEAYLQSLNSDEVAQIEADALRRADPVLLDGYHRSKKQSQRAHAAYRQILLEREVGRHLTEGSHSAAGGESRRTVAQTAKEPTPEVPASNP